MKSCIHPLDGLKETKREEDASIQDKFRMRVWLYCNRCDKTKEVWLSQYGHYHLVKHNHARAKSQ